VSAETERFTLELPPDPAFVATARMFASTLARHFEIAEDSVEDLKLAVSEACTRALAAREIDRPLSVTASRDDGRLIFEISQGEIELPAHVDTPTPSHQELAAGLSLELITALFADAALVSDGEGSPVVRFSVS
jgi:anti-sigma regulatory factor (Ser/Thr protein kinase)